MSFGESAFELRIGRSGIRVGGGAAEKEKGISEEGDPRRLEDAVHN
jgi:hypothetical protein